MPWAALLPAAASALISAGGSLLGSSQQQGAAQQGAGTQLAIYNQIRNDLAPYNQTGQGAVNQLASYWGLGSGGPGGTPGASVPGSAFGGTSSGTPANGGMSPGMVAALQATGTHGGAGRSLGSTLAFGLLGGKKNNSPIQDISQAIALGRPISDASWAQAGFGPGGAALGGLQQPSLAQANPTIAPPGTNGPVAGNPTDLNSGLAPSGNANNAFAQLQNYPGYQFQYDQGLQALNRNLSAGGRYTSGAMLKDAQSYGQGFAQNSVTNYLDMLKFLGGLGANAGAATGGFGTAAGQGIAQTQLAGGTAAAAGTAGAANAFSGLAGQIPFQSIFGGGNQASFNSGTGNWTPGAGGFPAGNY